MRLLSLALLFCFTASIAWSQQPVLLSELQQLRRDVAANQREINYEFQRVRAVVGILRDRQMQIHRMLQGEHVTLWEMPE